MKDNLLYITNFTDLIYFGLYCIVLFIIVYILARNKKSLFYALTFNVIIRIISVFFHYFLGHIPLLGLGFPDSQEDAIFFFKGAKNFDLSLLYSDFSGVFTDGVKLYMALLKIIMTISFSNHILILALFNSILSLFVIYNCYKIATLIWNENRVGIITLILLGCLPVFITYSIITLRETIISVFFSWSMLNFIYFYKNRNFINLLKSILFIVIAGLFHGGILIAIMLIIFCTVNYLIPFKDRYVKNLVRFCVLIAGLYFISSIISSGIGADKLAFFSSKDDQRELIKSRVEVLELRGNSNLDYGNNINLNSINDLISAAPYLYLNLLFRPKPFEYLADVFRLPGSWIVYLGVLFIMIKPKQYLGLVDKRILLIVIFGTWLAFSLGCFNVGQADRHRMKILPVFVTIMAKPISDFRLKRFINWK